jgi:hypothetical protein
MIKSSNPKSLTFRGDPTDSILAISIQPNSVQEIEERDDHFYLPIMHRSDEGDIPLICVVHNQQMV